MVKPRARLEPLAPEQWNARTRELLGGTLAPVADLEDRPGRGKGPLNILNTIAHHPRLLEPFLRFAAVLAAAWRAAGHPVRLPATR